MRLPDEYDDRPGMNGSMLRMMIGAILFISALLVLVLVLNKEDKPNRNAGNNSASVSEQSAQMPSGSAETVEAGTLSPEDFDFWDMYADESTVAAPVESKPEETKEEKDDPATDGKHTLVTYADGEEEWVLISPYLPKHEYDYTKLVCQSDIMKYYVDGKQVSYVGVDISKYQDYVDFVKLKKEGIDFVMIRAGARGYGTGQITMDEYFLDNMKRASDAGLEIGLYFFSQAITKEEAIEEANAVLQNIGEYKITYPIAIDMEFIPNDTARIENLSREEKTKITKAFLETIEDAGYLPMIYGNKEWLIKRIDLSKLTDYDVWLSQPGDLPDYPYKFTMWQYTNEAVVDGIAGYANLNISFIDYSEK